MGVAVIFPGQGAQAARLGAPWRDHPAWELVTQAEEATGEPFASLLLDAPAEELAATRQAQLVVFLASLLAWEVAAPALSGQVVAFAGHSLGQLTALVAAGALPFDAGCRLVSRRASHTQLAADTRPGGLAALLGATPEQAVEACAAAPGASWVANDNAPGQIVVGGTPEGLELVSARARQLGVKRAMVLNVGGAFHTPLMETAAGAFSADLAQAPFVDTAVPVISNTDALPYTDGAGWPKRLTQQLTQPVRWTATMSRLIEMGAHAFVEVGPGTTLAGLAKRAAPQVTLCNIAIPADPPLEIAHA